uniref:Uncharacterized protein n=1 Tax=Anguilla anguilla TaxID=7936 RepID=A0A0E9V6W0_ANGAN
MMLTRGVRSEKAFKLSDELWLCWLATGVCGKKQVTHCDKAISNVVSNTSAS